MSKSRVRRAERESELPWPPAFKASCTSVRDERRAGQRPNATLVRQASRKVKPRTARRTADCENAPHRGGPGRQAHRDPKRNQETQRAAQHSNDQTFDQQLPNDLATRRSNCGANGEFTRTRRARAANKFARFAQAMSKTRPTAPSNNTRFFSYSPPDSPERRHDRGLSGVRFGILLFQTRRDCFHLRARLLHGHAWF